MSPWSKTGQSAGAKPQRHLRSSDVLAVARLATHATAGVSRIVEAVHQSVWSSLGLPGGRGAGTTRGVTGLVYKAVHGVNKAVGAGVDGVLGKLIPLLDAVSPDSPSSTEREAVIAALNGVLGDQLAATGSPLATPMQFRFDGMALDDQALAALKGRAASARILLLVHGLCMNDLQWRSRRPAEDGAGTAEFFDHGQALAQQLGFTPVYLRYNSGLHVSQNGQQLAAMLDQLVANWPLPVRELSILAHSMGGLVTRSACHYAAQTGARWLAHLRSIAFLGTPHHGAPMERAGNWIDVVLASSRYSAPFASLGQLRSAGITDLRHGLVLERDWQGRDRFQRAPDRRHPLALPEQVACFTVAATLAAKRSLVAERLIGDGLVPLRSALGRHDRPELCLSFPESHQLIGYRMNHWDLLASDTVARQLRQWLAGN